MFLLEHDAKSLLALHGTPAPDGALLESAEVAGAQLPPAPWVVKAQIAAGGRGKAGLIRTAETRHELESHLNPILWATHKGMTGPACPIETLGADVGEADLSFKLESVSPRW